MSSPLFIHKVTIVLHCAVNANFEAIPALHNYLYGSIPRSQLSGRRISEPPKVLTLRHQNGLARLRGEGRNVVAVTIQKPRSRVSAA